MYLFMNYFLNIFRKLPKILTAIILFYSFYIYYILYNNNNKGRFILKIYYTYLLYLTSLLLKTNTLSGFYLIFYCNVLFSQLF